jgi:hypothetical protein
MAKNPNLLKNYSSLLDLHALKSSPQVCPADNQIFFPAKPL